MIWVNDKSNAMPLEERINQDIKSAMKSKDKAALRGLRAVKAAILLHKTSEGATAMNEADEIKLLQKLVKQRQESLDIYEKQNREDLAVTEREEIEVIQRYLPAAMSEEELKNAIQEIIRETGAESMKDMGKVMQIAQERLAGKADGKTMASIVRNQLG